MSLFNTLLLIGIAGTLSKLVRFDRESANDMDQWSKIIRQRLSSRSREGNEATYADTSLMISSDGSKNWDGISKSKNWDGLPNPQN
jgi:hypothetical protein